MKYALVLFFIAINFIAASNSVFGQSNYVRYEKCMEKFVDGVFGYNPYISCEENKKFYNDNGYTISYKIKDSSIYTWAVIILIIIIVIGVIINKRIKYNEKFKTQE